MYLEEIKFEEIKNLDIEDIDKIVVEEGRWAIIIIKECCKNIGLVGIIKDKFFQIIIKEEFRGRDYLRKIIDLIITEWNLNELYATIDRNNLRSMRAFAKLDYGQVFEGKIPKNSVRLKIK